MSDENVDVSIVDVTISEQLYDALGRPTIQTVTVKKGGEKDHQSQTLGFDKKFVANRNPESHAVYELSGDITQWLDSTRFDKANQPYAYSGHYYESNPLSRLSQATAPNQDFVYNKPHAQCYQYGQVTDQVATILQKNLHLSQQELQEKYRIAVNLSPLDKERHLNQTHIQDLTGKDIARVSVDPKGAYLLNSMEYDYHPSLTGNAVVNFTRKEYLPNAYSSVIAESQRSKFQIIQKYNALGQKICQQSSDAGVERYFYDDLGRMVFSQTPMQAAQNCIQYYEYDDLSRLTETGYCPQSSWDAAVLRSYQQKPKDMPNKTWLQRLCYDALSTAGNDVQTEVGHLLKRTDRANLKGIEIEESYTYNDQGYVKNYQVTSDPVTYEIGYQYNSIGNLLCMHYPKEGGGAGLSNFEVTYHYNLQGRLLSIGKYEKDTDFNDPGFYARYSYNADGSLAQEVVGSHRINNSFAYNTLGQLTQLMTPFFEENLSYRNNHNQYLDGNIISEEITYTKKGTLSPQNNTYRYQYDSFSRLTQACSDNNPMNPSNLNDMEYDPNGNIRQKSQGGTKDVYCYKKGTNQLFCIKTVEGTQDVSCYDQKTNKLSCLKTDQEYNYKYGLMCKTPNLREIKYIPWNHMPQCLNRSGRITNLLYNARGERLQKTWDNQEILYFRNLNAQVLREQRTDLGTPTTTTYIYGLNGLIAMEEGDQTYYLFKDHLGSTRIVSNGDAKPEAYFNYLPFGDLIEDNSSGAELQERFRYLYTGQEWDRELNLYNYHARQYDPVLGQFYTTDPAGEGFSPYAYVLDNPIRYTDPDGRQRFVYRGLEAGDRNLAEVLVHGLEPANVHGNTSIASHIEGNIEDSPWLSTSESWEVAVGKYGPFGHTKEAFRSEKGVIQIDLDKLGETTWVNAFESLTDEQKKGHLGWNAKADKEILIKGHIPAEAITEYVAPGADAYRLKLEKGIKPYQWKNTIREVYYPENKKLPMSHKGERKGRFVADLPDETVRTSKRKREDTEWGSSKRGKREIGRQ